MSGSAELIPLKDAAAQLGESTENTRLRAKRGLLVAEQRGKQGRWFVDPQSLAKLLRDLGRTPKIAPEISELAAEVRRLVAEMDALKARQAASPEDLGSLSRDRDLYRAEASTMRETAIRANAALRAAATGFRHILEALEEQTDALSELLGPRSPNDLGATKAGTAD